MTRRIATLIASLSLVLLSMLATAVPAFASVSCANNPSSPQIYGTGTALLIVYENPGYIIDSNDHYALCIKVPAGQSLGIANLKSVPYHTLYDIDCDGQLQTSFNTWNDCITAYQFSGGCHYRVTFYAEANYVSPYFTRIDAASDSDIGPFGPDNAISSIKITYSSVCQSSAGV